MEKMHKSRVNFLMICEKDAPKSSAKIVEPEFVISYDEEMDLMTRGGDFYAVWLEDKGSWSTKESEALQLIDNELRYFVEQNKTRLSETGYSVSWMWQTKNGKIDDWHRFVKKQMFDHYITLDQTLVFQNTPVSKKNYSSKRLSYSLTAGDHTNWDHLVGTLYSPAERHKIEWLIGAAITGESKELQKFGVFYGAPGTGKSTILNIISLLFGDFSAAFDANRLGAKNQNFALEQLAGKPLVAIQHDGDLSKIESNERLNSVISHETMIFEEKFHSPYPDALHCLLLMGTNKPVKITDAKSGLLRRLIDITPTGNKLPKREYNKTIHGTEFELGAIAKHCADIYLAAPEYYDSYIPVNMMGASNDFYNYVLDSYSVFEKDDSTSLKSAWAMYRTYCDEAKVPYPMSQRIFKEELKNYFQEYAERGVDATGARIRSFYSGFRTDKFETEIKETPVEKADLIEFGAFPSALDELLADCPAQYAGVGGTPVASWENVTTYLKDLDTAKLHYVLHPDRFLNLICIDFDIPDDEGKKCFERNLEAASKWPATYAELSKSGAGIHLHYWYTGDVTKLSRIFADHVEIKVFNGNSSLRRKLTKCNNLPIATITSNLPLKEPKKVVNKSEIQDQDHLRNTILSIIKNKHSPFGDSTTQCIHYINKILDEAYDAGFPYDVTNLGNAILSFASRSTNQSSTCNRIVAHMQLKSNSDFSGVDSEAPIVIFDVEVKPNHNLICYKELGLDKPVQRLYDPTRTEIEQFMKYRLVGFNNISYDNQIVYGLLQGYDAAACMKLSTDIVDKGLKVFPESKHISYTDLFDLAATKQSLKKWEVFFEETSEEEFRAKGYSDEEIQIIKRGAKHKEFPERWDQPIADDKLPELGDYCENDVLATEALYVYLKGDITARKILAELAGMTMNDSTNSLTTRIIFGAERHPALVYTHLDTGIQECPSDVEPLPPEQNAFPGYEFVNGKNMYRGVDLGYGGYVYSEPGMYSNVALLDVASLHPHSIKAMNCFGKYTQNFVDLINTRILIKHKEYDKAKKLFGGKLAAYLDDPKMAKQLSQALKIAINSVYGLTSASFQNPFYDIRNRNNIVALRGALFMKTLQDEVTKRGFKVAHIKTDSIKIANATQGIIDFCMEFAKNYGYTFEHEATYEKMCLVNKAVYIAKYSKAAVNGDHAGEWTATGTQFMVPYVFKSLFSKQPIGFYDKCETKSVKTAIYLDMNENLGPDEHDRYFVGRVGLFCPIKPGRGGGELVAEREKKGTISYDSVTGTKGYRWLEASDVQMMHLEDAIDETYYRKLVDEAVDSLKKYGDAEWFLSDDPVCADYPLDDDLPF